MIQGIGIDLIELNRIEKLIERQPGFLKRILTEREMDRFLTLSAQDRKSTRLNSSHR